MSGKSKTPSKRHLNQKKGSSGGPPAKSQATDSHSTTSAALPQQPETVEANSASPSPAPEITTTKQCVFKDANFVHSCKGIAATKKARVWRTLRQIVAADKALPWKPDDATYSSIEAPPSFKPAKKYSDITGLVAPYTDPQTKLRYHSTEEFIRIRMLPSDITAGYLALRKANVAVP